MQNGKKISQLGYVPENVRPGGEPGQNRMEEFHGGMQLNPLLQYPADPLINVQQLPQRRILDQTVHFKKSSAHSLAMDIQEHFSA